MDKLTIEVPEGEYCDSCNCNVNSNSCPAFYYSSYRKYNPEIKRYKKCPACVSAIKAYKDMHDYKKASEKVMHILDDHMEFTIDTKRDMILKALEYEKEKKDVNNT